MNAAVISFGVILSVMIICGSALVVLDQDLAGWLLLVFGFFGAFSLLGMIVSTGVAGGRPIVRRQPDQTA